MAQVTHAGIAGWLASRPRWSRLQDASTLRTLFATLEAERLIFANRARAAGHWPVSLLKNLGG